MMKKKLIFPVLMSLLLASCAKEDRPADVGDRVNLRVSPLVTASPEQPADTRTALWDGFVNNSQIGLGFFEQGSFTAYDAGYQNILGTRNNNGVWAFRPAGAGSNISTIGVFKSKGAVDIYGHFPYNSAVGAVNIRQIPFTVGTTVDTNQDYMVSLPLSYDPVTDDAVITPVFHHVMTVLEFQVQTSYVGPMHLNSITLKASEPIFGMSGTIDATSADPAGAVTVTPASLTDELTIAYDITVPYSQATGTNPKYYSAAMIFPEIEVAETSDVTITVTFHFDTDMPLFEGGGSYTVNLKDIVVSDGTDRYGFLSGYRYIFAVKVDNFVKYSGYPVIVYWSDGTTTEIEF